MAETPKVTIEEVQQALEKAKEGIEELRIKQIVDEFSNK